MKGRRATPLRKLITVAILVLAGPVLAPSESEGQAYTFTFGGLLGLGGSFDESDAGYGNFSGQLSFTNTVADNTLVGIRVGGISWGSNDELGPLTGPSLLYATVAGEYKETSGSFSGSFIESGVYIGLGYYKLDGDRTDGGVESDDGFGLTVGVTGDLPVNKRRNLALRIELAGHYADLDAAQLFGTAMIGLAYRY